MKKFIPTMSTSGWSNDIARTADYLLSCYLTTQTSDSTLHREQNTSMQYTLKINADKPLDIEEQMTQDLTAKFQATYGNSAEVYVDVTADDEKPDQFSISFTATVYDDDGKSYVVGKLVNFADGRVVKIANLNNG